MREAQLPISFQASECPSGFHRRRPPPPSGPGLRELLEEARTLEGVGFVAMVLEPCAGHDVRAGISRACRSGVDTGPSLPANLRAWVKSVEEPSIIPVPMLLQHWLPIGTAMVLPMFTPAWRAGAVIVSATWATQSRLGPLRSLAAEVALKLEEAHRRRPRTVSSFYGVARTTWIPQVG